MNSYENARFKGELENAGNNVEYFTNYNNIIQVNDGVRRSFDRTVNCGGSGYADCPFGENRETLIQMTHQDHDISEFDNGYFTLTVEATLHASGVGTVTDDEHLYKIFHGFKDSNQIIDRPCVVSGNTTTNYYQPESVREGFAYARSMLKIEKKTRKYTHSLAENVDAYSQSVAGSYINLSDLANGASVIDTYEINIPFDDLAAFQAFEMVPNFATGQLALKTYIAKKGMVYKFVNPNVVKDVKELLEGDTVNTTDATFYNSTFDHKFIQMGQSCTGIVSIDETSSTNSDLLATTGSFTLYCDSINITSFKANMRGYKIKDNAKRSIIEDLQKGPKIIPCQFLEYNSWNASPSSGGINTNIKTALDNVTSILVAFPHTDSDYTVFENPMYSNLQLRIDGTNYPEEVYSTNDARFYQNQLIASDLDGAAECTKEFEDSITMTRNATDGTRYANTLADNTAFLWEVPLERKGAGICFDGYSSNDVNVSVQITGQPIYGSTNDTYYNYKDGFTPVPPQFWVISEKFFTFDCNGFKFHKTDVPWGSQTEDN